MRGSMTVNRIGSGAHVQSRGFSLIEVLIAVVILAIGLLGVAAVQVVSLQQTNNSFLQTKANLHVQDIAERLRANGGDALPAGQVTAMTSEVQSDLGDGASVQIALNGSLATITLTWEEKVPVSQEADGTQTKTLTVEARVAPR